jgi:hypothetical protein
MIFLIQEERNNYVYYQKNCSGRFDGRQCHLKDQKYYISSMLVPKIVYSDYSFDIQKHNIKTFSKIIKDII